MLHLYISPIYRIGFRFSVRFQIPVPGNSNVKDVGVYVKEGHDWVRSCSNDCDVDANGYGWMVPGSRVNHNNGSPSSIEIMVYHSAEFQAGVATGAEATPTSADEEAGAKCFVDTLLY